MEKNQASNKIVARLNREVRDYVYGPRRMFAPLHIVFAMFTVMFATIAGVTFAQHMAPTPADGVGTFADGYTHRYMFEVGALAAIIALVIVRRVFRAALTAYVRRLDMDDGIRAGGVKPNASDADAKSVPSCSRDYAGSENGDYVSAVDSREDTISESEGGDA